MTNQVVADVFDVIVMCTQLVQLLPGRLGMNT